MIHRKFIVNKEHDFDALRDAFDDLKKQKMTVELGHQMFRAWNSTWAVNKFMLLEIYRRVRRAEGNILECGSGLSTLVAAAALKKIKSDFKIYALEQKEFHANDVTKNLERLKLGGYARVIISPLKVRETFSWYSPDLDSLPMFDMVLCDGPPGGTKGGRYGMLPVMHRKLNRGCTIMLDDAGISKGYEALHKWEKKTGSKGEIFPCGLKKFAILKLP